MFDRIINILIVEDNEQDLATLLSAIENPGHNVFVAKSLRETEELLSKKSFVLILCSLQLNDAGSAKILSCIHDNTSARDTSLIVTSYELDQIIAAVNPTHFQGVTDFLQKPFSPELVKSKIRIYRKTFFKHQRVSRLLESILPEQILEEFSTFGKSSPKKKTNTAILFTDFVNFTKKTRNLAPGELVKKLDYYFTRFDEIMQQYHLEKIKTIGDAYMAVGGVTEKIAHPILRTALAAIEIRNFILTDIATEKALGNDFWEIRIGLHCGDLVAGVVGTQKFSFDVWGDAVNIAARCEQHSQPNKINISGSFYAKIENYFDCTPRGKVAIKNAGEIDMYFLDSIKEEFSLYQEGRVPTVELRKTVALPPADFEGIRNYILTRLKADLDGNLSYHSWEHTVLVEEAVIKYGELENITSHELFLVRTAALFHDAGFIFQYHNNEQLGVDLFREVAPRFGYDKNDMDRIEAIIFATAHGNEPHDLLEAIMCDADLDYLGRIDYHVTAGKLFDEMVLFGEPLTEKQKIEMQIDYLSRQHCYFTTSAKNIRQPGKLRRLEELLAIYEKYKA